MTDQPIAWTREGRPLFDNTPTVVCAAVPVEGGILAVRRAHEPGAGKLGLPGGYHMRGESWQMGGAREVMEETGYAVDPGQLTVRHLVTDEYGNNVVFAFHEGEAEPTAAPLDGEALEIVVVREGDLDPEDWAFPLHRAFAARALYELKLQQGLRSLLNARTDDGLGVDSRQLALGLLAGFEGTTQDWRRIARSCHYEHPETEPALSPEP
ncbi:NUDIX domain-containing protein [Defluviimonas salinarum]|uniref:NUDIX domain-containing protein n=1 Tax=Defluviimonas salinarum TaxID=2992147 RepID=A0ABT3J6I1_9RHOB|nr:NUDIX domain-containing protein [Defluviimonas salinarum]